MLADFVTPSLFSHLKLYTRGCRRHYTLKIKPFLIELNAMVVSLSLTLFFAKESGQFWWVSGEFLLARTSPKLATYFDGVVFDSFIWKPLSLHEFITCFIHLSISVYSCLVWLTLAIQSLFATRLFFMLQKSNRIE